MAVQYTNKHGLPQHIYDAVVQDDHVVNGDISVTQLIDSPQIRILKRQHQYEMDAMDLIPAFMGTGLHTVLERADTAHRDIVNIRRAITTLANLGNQTAIIEALRNVISKYFDEQVDKNIVKEWNITLEVNGMVISGTFDRFEIDTQHLQDYKQCKAISFTFPEFVTSWKMQLNTYAAMLRANGQPVKRASVHAFFKDWGKAHMLRNSAYPKRIWQQVEIPLGEQEAMMEWIEGRVKLHQRAEAGEQILCTAKERWQKADTYKVMKRGNKTSKGNRPSPEMAQALMEEKQMHDPIGKYRIEFFPGESTRCAEYCPVARFCPQYKEELELIVQKSNQFPSK